MTDKQWMPDGPKLTGLSVGGVLMALLAMAGYVALMGAARVEVEQAVPEPGVAGDTVFRAYSTWLAAAHAHAAAQGDDGALPGQF